MRHAACLTSGKHISSERLQTARFEQSAAICRDLWRCTRRGGLVQRRRSSFQCSEPSNMFTNSGVPGRKVGRETTARTRVQLFYI